MSSAVGIASDVERLVADASSNVHAARSGKSAAFTKSVRPLDERRQLIEQLAVGLKAGQVRPWFQPIVGAADRQIKGWEALVRWEHPRLGLLGPDRFLELASVAGLSGTITDIVVERSMEFVRDLEMHGLERTATVHVNVSATDLRRERFGDFVGDHLGRYGIKAGQIVLEITEQNILQIDDDVSENLHRLAVLGVPLAVDDFGTGYSSLSHLLDLRASSLKIDRRFVAGLPSHYESRTLVAAVIGMARGLGLITVAEGVETAGQAQMLRDLGCDEFQGFLFSAALSPEGAVRFALGLRADDDSTQWDESAALALLGRDVQGQTA
jgi:diguanylate cyclase